MKLDFHRNERLLFGVVLVGFILLSLLISVGPAIWAQDNTYALPNSAAPTAQQLRGRAVYVSEGCAYCHTQQVRPLAVDANWGRASVPGDYAYLQRPGVWIQTPALLGTQRTGPDLSTIGKRQPSETWQLIHLYQPRALVPDSVMPAFPWLFRLEPSPGADETVVELPDPYGPSQGKVVATRRAQDLVAYLLSLEQTKLEGKRWGQVSQPAASKASAGAAPSQKGPDGASLFASNCASCHGQSGAGVPNTFPSLHGDPVVTAEDPTEHISILLGGLQGKTIGGVKYAAAMPAFADQLSDDEIAAIINYERTSWGNAAPKVTADQVAKVRSQSGD